MINAFKVVLTNELKVGHVASGIPELNGRLLRQVNLDACVSIVFGVDDEEYTAKLVGKTLQSEQLSTEELTPLAGVLTSRLREIYQSIELCKSIKRVAKNNGKISEIEVKRMIESNDDMLEVRFKIKNSGVVFVSHLYANGNLDFGYFENQSIDREKIIEDVGFWLSYLKYEVVKSGISLI